MKVSVVVLTGNEEDRIAKCLESVKWAGEIIVIDDYSEDKTREIARRKGAKVYKRRLSPSDFKARLSTTCRVWLKSADFAAQRNFGLEKAKSEWVFFVDADEIVTPELAREIRAKLLTPGDLLRPPAARLPARQGEAGKTPGVLSSDVVSAGFKVKRVDYMWGRELRYGDVRNVKLVRLGRKEAGRWMRDVHEIWDIRGKIGEMGGEIKHYPHPNVAQFLEDIRQYSQLHAQALQKEGVKTNLFQILAFPVGKFFVNYVVKLGFLDGTAGFVHAMMMSLHSFLARSQLWMRQHKD